MYFSLYYLEIPNVQCTKSIDIFTGFRLLQAVQLMGLHRKPRSRASSIYHIILPWLTSTATLSDVDYSLHFLHSTNQTAQEPF